MTATPNPTPEPPKADTEPVTAMQIKLDPPEFDRHVAAMARDLGVDKKALVAAAIAHGINAAAAPLGVAMGRGFTAWVPLHERAKDDDKGKPPPPAPGVNSAKTAAAAQT